MCVCVCVCVCVCMCWCTCVYAGVCLTSLGFLVKLSSPTLSISFATKITLIHHDFFFHFHFFPFTLFIPSLFTHIHHLHTHSLFLLLLIFLLVINIPSYSLVLHLSLNSSFPNILDSFLLSLLTLCSSAVRFAYIQLLFCLPLARYPLPSGTHTRDT